MMEADLSESGCEGNCACGADSAAHAFGETGDARDLSPPAQVMALMGKARATTAGGVASA